MQTSSPSPGAVWFTIAEANAAKAQGEASSPSAAFARRIQCARVLKGMLLIMSCGPATTLWTCPKARPASAKVLEMRGRNFILDTAKS